MKIIDMRSGTSTITDLVSNGLELSEMFTFTPTKLFKDGKQGVWYDPSDKSTLFQDVAGTVPVTKDGDPVALMRDKSGNDNHATQSVSTSRPIYKTDGILHWLVFDGVDDFLEAGQISIAYSATSVLFELYNSAVIGIDGLFQYIYGRSAGKIYIYSGSRFSTSLCTLGKHVLTSQLDNSLGTVLRIDGKTNNVLALPKVEGKLLIGRRRVLLSDAWSLKGDFYSLITVNSKVSDSNNLLIENYLSSKAGVTL